MRRWWRIVKRLGRSGVSRRIEIGLWVHSLSEVRASVEFWGTKHGTTRDDGCQVIKHTLRKDKSTFIQTIHARTI